MPRKRARAKAAKTRSAPTRAGRRRAFAPVPEQMDRIRAGTVEIVPEEDLARKLEASRARGVPLVVKQGFDPTRPDLHVGHAVSIRKLKDFQDLGHQVVFVIGDFTALVGDPSGQSETRPALSESEVRENLKTYESQVFRILDRTKTRIERNSRWLSKLTPAKMIELTARYTVARLLERDDFAERYREGRPISVVELLYPLLQAYDSVALEADVELGGTDQKFNLLVARAIQERYGQRPQVCVILPLLRGTDGELKMSKSYDNYVGITDPPEDQYGKTMSIPDALLEEWIALVSSWPEAERQARAREAARRPWEVKRALARNVVEQYHGAAAATRAEAHFDRVVRRREAPEEIPEKRIRVAEPELWIARALVEAGFARSNSDALRLVDEGAVQVDGTKVTARDFRIPARGSCVLRKGKRHFVRLVFDAAP